jgi:hemerythrin-like domain-containing protein
VGFLPLNKTERPSFLPLRLSQLAFSIPNRWHWVCFVSISIAKLNERTLIMAKTPQKKNAAKKNAKASPKKAAGKPTVTKMNAKGAGKGAQNEDIIQLILEDHKPLKRLIKIMKDSDAELSERQDAFEEFAPLLVVHAKPEEQTLYVTMKEEDEMREEGFEGDVEHQLADQLLEEIKRTDDEDLWSARVKVLAELVEHHIEEEEDEMLPDFKKEIEISERVELGQEYLRLKAKYEDMGGKDTVRESNAEARP